MKNITLDQLKWGIFGGLWDGFGHQNFLETCALKFNINVYVLGIIEYFGSECCLGRLLAGQAGPTSVLFQVAACLA